MYDYATVTKQNQIIEVIEDNTQAINTLNGTIIQTGIIIASLISIILIKSFVKICVGGR